MVYFVDESKSHQDYLVILDDKGQDVESGTRLRVHKPLAGRIVEVQSKLVNLLHRTTWTRETSVTKTSTAWKLESSHHWPSKEVVPLLTLGRRIAEGNARWGDDVDFLGEFRYFKGYWEWSEDVLSRHEDMLRSVGIYDPVFASLFTYDRNTEIIKAFCEAWCSSTNTLLTPLGELSISLWDLHFLSGLPAVGMFFDEVVPCVKELVGHRSEKTYLPRCCRYLFHAYHLIAREKTLSDTVTIEEWIKFWSKKGLRYQRPPPRKEKKSARSKFTHNPPGVLKAHDLWTPIEESIFSRLGASKKHWNEIHLAAYLACWLCAFVLPNGDALIRPSTFKMASLMAIGEHVVLTVPVLASIFRGLNNIADSVEPCRLQTSFPMHFVYSWLAYYFKTHYLFEPNPRTPKMVQYSGEGGARNFEPDDARKRIHKYDHVAWNCTIFAQDDDIAFSDVAGTEGLHRCFFMAIRSSYLARRLDDHFIIESYSPHRFGRQFGYLQDMPGVLKQRIRRVSLEDGYMHWRACTTLRTASEAVFPRLLQGGRRFQTSEYRDWWAEVYKNSFEVNIRTATPIEHRQTVEAGPSDGKQKMSVSPSLLEQHEAVEAGPSDGKRRSSVSSLHGSDSDRGDRHWKRTRPEPLVEGNDESGDCEPNAFARKVLEEVLGITDAEEDSQGSHRSVESDHLSGTPCLAKKVSAKPVLETGVVSGFDVKNMIDDEFKLFLRKIWSNLRDTILKTEVESLSVLKDEIQKGISCMKNFGDFDISPLESSVDMLFSRAAAFDQARLVSRDVGESSARRLAEVKTSLHNAQAKEKETNDQIASSKRELVALEKRKEELTLSLEQDCAVLGAICSEIEAFAGEIKKLEDSPIDVEVLENLKTSELLLRDAQKALEDQDLFAQV